MSGLIKELFHKEEEEASLSVYAAVQQIRTVLEENTYYNKYLSEEDTAGDDLLKEFLQGSGKEIPHIILLLPYLH